jgi:hypothetical protein
MYGQKSYGYGHTHKLKIKSFRRRKSIANKQIFEIGERVIVHGRGACIESFQKDDGITIYRVEWDEGKPTWFGEWIGESPSKFEWVEPRFIKRESE